MQLVLRLFAPLNGFFCSTPRALRVTGRRDGVFRNLVRLARLIDHLMLTHPCGCGDLRRAYVLLCACVRSAARLQRSCAPYSVRLQLAIMAGTRAESEYLFSCGPRWPVGARVTCICRQVPMCSGATILYLLWRSSIALGPRAIVCCVAFARPYSITMCTIERDCAIKREG
jgi:hypothetical protein